MLFYQVEEFPELRCAFRISPVQIFLKARDMDVKAEYFLRKRMRCGEFFRAPDSLLPEGIAHGLIIGLLTLSGNFTPKNATDRVVENIIHLKKR